MPTITTSSSGWTSNTFRLLTIALTALTAFTPIVSVSAKYTCDSSSSAGYPYCVNIPDGGENLPVILFLAGSGARGDASRVKELSGYDGIGKLINQYQSGNKGADQSMAANDFVTIIPVSPMNANGGEVRHWWPSQLDTLLDTVGSKFSVDTSKVHVTGYSMGCRGTWRYIVNSPGRVASASCSAGSAESAGDGTLSQQKADPVFPMLKNAANIPMWQFAGSNDQTAGTKNPEKSVKQLETFGDSGCKYSVLDASHNDMGLKPFDSNLMAWVKENVSSGSSSSKKVSTSDSSDSDSSETSSDSSSSDSSSASSSDTKYKTSTSSTGGTNPKSNSSSSTGKTCLRKRSRSKRAPVINQRSLRLSDILAARESKTQTLSTRSESEQEEQDPHSKAGAEWFERSLGTEGREAVVGNATQKQQKRAHDAIKMHARGKQIHGRRGSNRH